MRLRTWIKSVPSLAIIGAILFLVMSVGGGLLLWGSNFSRNMVHDQLADQRISFPEKGSPGFDAKDYPGLQRYAGQAVDSGPKAKAYAEQYIKAHLAETADGKTYSEVSSLSRANPDDEVLAGQVQSLFRGETLRGLLLYAWGWSVVGMIAFWSGLAALLGAAGVLGALVLGFVMHERDLKRRSATTVPSSANAVRAHSDKVLVS
jgi:hypothetical protein